MTNVANKPSSKIELPFFMAAFVAFLALSIYQAQLIYRLENYGLATDGTVSSVTYDNSGKTTIYSLNVNYKTTGHHPVKFRNHISQAESKIYHPNDVVKVLYFPENPEDDAIVDRGWHDWDDVLSYLFCTAIFGALVGAIKFIKPETIKNSTKA